MQGRQHGDEMARQWQWKRWSSPFLFIDLIARWEVRLRGEYVSVQVTALPCPPETCKYKRNEMLPYAHTVRASICVVKGNIRPCSISYNRPKTNTELILLASIVCLGNCSLPQSSTVGQKLWKHPKNHWVTFYSTITCINTHKHARARTHTDHL